MPVFVSSWMACNPRGQYWEKLTDLLINGARVKKLEIQDRAIKKARASMSQAPKKDIIPTSFSFFHENIKYWTVQNRKIGRYIDVEAHCRHILQSYSVKRAET